MNKNIKKCSIERYDETIKKAPLLTIEIDQVVICKPEIDDGGVEFAKLLLVACKSKGYVFRFYSLNNKDGFDYKIVVY